MFLNPLSVFFFFPQFGCFIELSEHFQQSAPFIRHFLFLCLCLSIATHIHRPFFQPSCGIHNSPEAAAAPSEFAFGPESGHSD
jgi:hypothetical protein